MFGYSEEQIAAFGLVGYVYKITTAVLLTPLLYLIHGLIKRYLGAALTTRLKHDALGLE